MEISEKTLADGLRFLAMDIITNAGSGHPGMPLGFADVMMCLYKNHINFNPQNPAWANRDRLILSCGHGVALLYAALYLLGYDYSLEDLSSFRKVGSKTPGHPEFNIRLGIEATTGPLGQGCGMAVGVALEGAKLNALFPDEISYKTYVIVSDGDLMEGVSHEAFSFAGTYCLKDLIVLYDSNNVTIDGHADLSCKDNVRLRFESYNFFVQEIDGHNYSEINNAIERAKQSDRPSIIICKTRIGLGTNKENTSAIHGSPLSLDELNRMKSVTGWNYDLFQLPDFVLQYWQNFKKRCKNKYAEKTNKYENFIALKKSITFNSAQSNFTNGKGATRSFLGIALKQALEVSSFIIGGSADLGGSTNTLTTNSKDITPSDYSGNYVNYGIREHAMGAIANGIALNGVFKVYTSTFLSFSDYMKPAIRLAAMMGLEHVFIFTHDSVGVGEDGPTHQPIEHLAQLRAVPNLALIRPCNEEETIFGAQTAFSLKSPSVLILSRQKCEEVPYTKSRNMVIYGGYVMVNDERPDITLVATGSEVGLALKVKSILNNYNKRVSLVSMPCVEFFLSQSLEYRNSVLGVHLIAFIEAGSIYGLSSLARRSDMVFGIDTFGKSGKAWDVFKCLNFTADSIVNDILCRLNGS